MPCEIEEIRKYLWWGKGFILMPKFGYAMFKQRVLQKSARIKKKRVYSMD